MKENRGTFDACHLAIWPHAASESLDRRGTLAQNDISKLIKYILNNLKRTL